MGSPRISEGFPVPQSCPWFAMSADVSMATTPQEATAGAVPPPTDSEMGEAPKADRELSDRERAAVRQSAFIVVSRLALIFSNANFLVEFYFADSNLPYDKCVGLSYSSLPLYLRDIGSCGHCTRQTKVTGCQYPLYLRSSVCASTRRMVRSG